MSTSASFPSSRRAITIGNNAADSANPLVWAERDAHAMAEALREHGDFATQSLLGPSATVEATVELLREQARGGGLLVVHLAGHGGWSETDSDHFFVAAPRSRAKSQARLHLRKEIIELVIGESDGETALVLIGDICREFTDPRRSRSGGGRARNLIGISAAKKLKREFKSSVAHSASSITLLWATYFGGTADEDDRVEGGLLSRALIHNLRQQTDDLDANEWLAKAQHDAKRSHIQQRLSGYPPEFYIQHGGPTQPPLIRHWKFVAKGYQQQLEGAKLSQAELRQELANTQAEYQQLKGQLTQLQREGDQLRAANRQLQTQLEATLRLPPASPARMPLRTEVDWRWEDAELSTGKFRCLVVEPAHVEAFRKWCRESTEPLSEGGILTDALRRQIGQSTSRGVSTPEWIEAMAFANWVALVICGAPEWVTYFAKIDPERTSGIRLPLPRDFVDLKAIDGWRKRLAKQPWWLTTSQWRKGEPTPNNHQLSDPLDLGGQERPRYAWSVGGVFLNAAELKAKTPNAWLLIHPVPDSTTQ